MGKTTCNTRAKYHLIVVDFEKHFNKKINDKNVTWRFNDFNLN